MPSESIIEVLVCELCKRGGPPITVLIASSGTAFEAMVLQEAAGNVVITAEIPTPAVQRCAPEPALPRKPRSVRRLARHDRALHVGTSKCYYCKVLTDRPLYDGSG